MSRIYAIALNTFREAVRDRVLYALLGAGISVVLFALALGELSLHQESRVVEDLGLATVSLFSAWTSIFLGSSLLYKEIERKTLYVILPKPISRAEFLLGKYLGIALTIFVFVSVMGGALLGVLAVEKGLSFGFFMAFVVGVLSLFALGAWKFSSRTELLLPFSLGCLLGGIAIAMHSGVPSVLSLGAIALAFGEALFVGAVAMVFSSFSTPFLTGVFTFGIWVLGRSADEMEGLRSRELPELLVGLVRGLSRVVPNFHLFVPGRHAFEVLGPDGSILYVARTLGYGALYATLMLAASVALFRRRDLA
jgi:Cu-processing system permease protein